MSKLDLTPLFERMADAEQPPESASLREARRTRVIGDMRRRHVELIHERGQRTSVRRLTRVILIAATLAVAGGAFASMRGYGPLASPRQSSGAPEATSHRAPLSPTHASPTATPPPAPTNDQAAPALDTPGPAASPASPAPAPAAHATGTAARRVEMSAREAINRLFAEAKRARREDRNADALALLDQLLGKYPHSVLAQEASVERYRVLSKLGRAAEARREAAAYLSRYPSGFAASEAERLSGSADAP